MTTQTTGAAELPDPSPDQLRAIAQTARNGSGSASDDCGPLAYVLHGWRAAAIAFRAQQAAQVEALSAAQAGVRLHTGEYAYAISENALYHLSPEMLHERLGPEVSKQLTRVLVEHFASGR